MNIKKWGLSLICLVSLNHLGVAQAAEEGIHMMGLSNTGEPIDVVVSNDVYKENLKKAIAAVEMSSLPTLQKKSESAKGWMLRTAVVGIGVNLEVGIAEIKFGVLPRFRIGFSNAKEPSVP